MLHEIEALEAKQIAELASDAQALRARLLEKVRSDALGEPQPARGEHDPARTIALNGLFADAPEIRRLREAITALPNEIRHKLWALMAVGRGDYAARELDLALEAIANAHETDIIDELMREPYLHDYLAKALHETTRAKPAKVK
jgi:hypothetical protein